jgi:hypothetical protein
MYQHAIPVALLCWYNEQAQRRLEQLNDHGGEPAKRYLRHTRWNIPSTSVHGAAVAASRAAEKVFMVRYWRTQTVSGHLRGDSLK